MQKKRPDKTRLTEQSAQEKARHNKRKRDGETDRETETEKTN